MEGRASAGHLLRREGARGRVVADRPRRKGRRHVARSLRRAALFLVRRGRHAGCRKMAGEARRAIAPRPSAARSRVEIAVADRQPPRPARQQEASGRCARPGTARTRTSIPPGSRSCSMRRSTQSPSWKALHEVLRDSSRNVLFNHLGLNEDKMGMVVRPDCADLPYFLRAYFAFKMGLPLRLREVHARRRRRGAEVPGLVEHPERGAAPHASTGRDGRGRESASCAQRSVRVLRPAGRRRPEPGDPHWHRRTGLGRLPGAAPKPPPGPPPRPAGLVPAFGHYLKWSIGDGVHSGAGRTRLNDDNTDFYPVPLNEDTLRPGTVYADPYGHLLVLARRVPQTGDAAGVFLAVDAQPDGTVARKRFWRGNFLFAQDPALGGPGFKRFRPVMRDKGGTLRRLTNDRDRQASAVRRFFARPGAAGRRSLLRPHGRRDVALAARSGARHEGGDHLARRAGEGARDVGGERAQVPDQREGRGVHAGRRGDLRDHRRVGGFRDAVA